MYPQEEWEEVEEASLDVLNPVVLEKERKSLWNNLKTLEESLSALTEKVWSCVECRSCLASGIKLSVVMVARSLACAHAHTRPWCAGETWSDLDAW